ncbi:MAG: histidine kinase [Spirosoma sp.]|nr:histidine kinase [Spirosoma sp.]
MKQFVVGILCLWVGCTGAVGQVSISSGASLLRADWRFKAGDNPLWADSAFDARFWQKKSPLAEIDPAAVNWPGNRGWYRAVFQPKSAMSGQDLMLTVTQFGSSVIFLDGKQLAMLKSATFDSGGSQRIMRYIPLRFADTSQHVLAIRYQFRRDPMYASITIKPVEIQLRPLDEVGIDNLNTIRFNGFMEAFFISVFGVLALLHLLFYQANKAGRVNRTLAWTMLAFFVLLLVKEADEYADTLTERSLFGLAAQLSLPTGFALLLTAVYQYLRIRRGWFFYGVTGLLAVDLLYRLTLSDTPKALAWIPYALVLVDYVRVSWLGRRSGDRDARLPWNSLRYAGFSLAFIILCGTAIAVLEANTNVKISGLLLIPVIFFAITTLFSIPVGLSLSLVRDYARTHRALGDNLREVEQLSARALAQEQEKQHLLARQNELLEEQVHERTAELNQSLTELRATQVQLVQREKLASLGELTAGIAHEIQNPLNFVTNFAEVSVELVDELNVEQNQPADQRDDALIDELLGDLGQNVQKISEHGKRAASIVRGMLQHSRASTGQKQPTNLNALVDESMKLAYHGLRATDKNFNVTLQTDFAPDVPTVSVVPEDIGRVLVNLFNNAFYAVKEATIMSAGSFAPTVSVQTVLDNGQVVIRVADNGPGITDAVRQKIFQPFFTTKPTGQGTGLGLSISYDIITKGHGGTLSVETEPGNTVFTIRLPLQQA